MTTHMEIGDQRAAFRSRRGGPTAPGVASGPGRGESVAGPIPNPPGGSSEGPIRPGGVSAFPPFAEFPRGMFRLGSGEG